MAVVISPIKDQVNTLILRYGILAYDLSTMEWILQQPKRKKGKMNTSKTVTKDPVCGMSVDESSALSTKRNGKTFYFCSDHCQKKFTSAPSGAKPEEKSHSCCA